ncbi:hypothetical protein [Pusillimonas sp.]|uniref:hypothetical protein n=1 Tax=Pusillimonas sp. TaxID=3040095 RepID=UPI0029B49415|nr:hypothetical protein [Pusillimonas sp.]MDX3894157.1 hypothetical protein [Pusillimonas sp.]
MRLLIAGGLCLGLAACASTDAIVDQGQPQAQRVQADQATIDAALQSVKSKLKNPDEAKFSGIYATEVPGSSGGPVVCGLVDIKTRHGYTGDLRFASSDNVTVIEDKKAGGRTAFNNDVIRNLCSVAGS